MCGESFTDLERGTEGQIQRRVAMADGHTDLNANTHGKCLVRTKEGAAANLQLTWSDSPLHQKSSSNSSLINATHMLLFICCHRITSCVYYQALLCCMSFFKLYIGQCLVMITCWSLQAAPCNLWLYKYIDDSSFSEFSGIHSQPLQTCLHQLFAWTSLNADVITTPHKAQCRSFSTCSPGWLFVVCQLHLSNNFSSYTTNLNRQTILEETKPELIAAGDFCCVPPPHFQSTSAAGCQMKT